MLSPAQSDTIVYFTSVTIVCVASEYGSPSQSRKTSPSTSPASSLYGGTSNPSQPASESTTDGPFKKKSKPAVILRKVKSLTSTITENVTMREGTSTGRPVAMVKGLISSLTGGISPGNVTTATVDMTSVTATVDSLAASTSDVTINDTVSVEQVEANNDVAEEPPSLSDAANQLTQETLTAR